MDERQTVDQNGHIVARIVLALGFFVLIDDLQAVIVNILFIFAVETAKIGCARHNAQAALGILLSAGTIFADETTKTCEKEK